MFYRIWTVLVLVGLSLNVVAEELPLWEAGVGVGAVITPDYRGADETSSYALPIPYLVYRGERLRADRRGLRGELFESNRVSLNLSASLGPPADSDENQARAGMPDLNPTVEIGPSLNIRLDNGRHPHRTVSLRLPVRTVIATDLSHAEHAGWVFLPHLALDYRHVGPGGGWGVGISAGPIYANNKYHDYFYAVAPEFATATRTAFDASGGYSGFSLGLAASKRSSNYWMGLFVRYDNLSGAAFEDSPLVRTKHALIAGFGISRILARSQRSGKPLDDELP